MCGNPKLGEYSGSCCTPVLAEMYTPSVLKYAGFPPKFYSDSGDFVQHFWSDLTAFPAILSNRSGFVCTTILVKISFNSGGFEQRFLTIVQALWKK